MSGPGLWQVDIEKVLGTEYWTNVYYVAATSLTDAAIEAAKIKEIERGVHQTEVGFTKYRVRGVGGEGNIGTAFAIGQNGLSAEEAPYLPLFCVARFDLTVVAGRPSRKYLRLPLNRLTSANGALEAATQTFLQSNYAAPLAALESLRDENGNDIIAVNVHPFIAMRQLRRGSKRRTQPVL